MNGEGRTEIQLRGYKLAVCVMNKGKNLMKSVKTIVNDNVLCSQDFQYVMIAGFAWEMGNCEMINMLIYFIIVVFLLYKCILCYIPHVHTIKFNLKCMIEIRKLNWIYTKHCIKILLKFSWIAYTWILIRNSPKWISPNPSPCFYVGMNGLGKS